MGPQRNVTVSLAKGNVLTQARTEGEGPVAAEAEMGRCINRPQRQGPKPDSGRDAGGSPAESQEEPALPTPPLPAPRTAEPVHAHRRQARVWRLVLRLQETVPRPPAGTRSASGVLIAYDRGGDAPTSGDTGCCSEEHEGGRDARAVLLPSRSCIQPHASPQL